MSAKTLGKVDIEVITRHLSGASGDTRVEYARVDHLVRWMLDSGLPDVAKAIATPREP